MIRNLCLFLWIIASSGIVQAQTSQGELSVFAWPGSDGNVSQVASRHTGTTDALYIGQNDNNPIQTITKKLKSGHYAELHLFVTSNGDDISFNSLSITPENITEYSAALNKWQDRIQNKIVVHNRTLAGQKALPDVIGKLRLLTGLPVEVVNYYY